MPVYLLTFHAYRSWMPDRKRGYVRRGDGVVPPNTEKARQYAADAKESESTFHTAQQQSCIEALIEACKHQNNTLHFVATDSTHVHVLLSWTGDRPVAQVRSSVKQSMTRHLNNTERRTWFGRNASRKRVRDRKHFDYLMTQYLPSHRGLKWNEAHGIFQ